MPACVKAACQSLLNLQHVSQCSTTDLPLACSETSISEALRYSLNRRSTLQTIRRLQAPPTPAEPPRYQPGMLQSAQQVWNPRVYSVKHASVWLSTPLMHCNTLIKPAAWRTGHSAWQLRHLVCTPSVICALTWAAADARR